MHPVPQNNARGLTPLERKSTIRCAGKFLKPERQRNLNDQFAMTNKAPNRNDQRTAFSNWSMVIGHWLVIGACSLVVCAPASAQQPKSPRIASLVPAATDLVVGMGAIDHLVAVSNQDSVNRPEIRQFPRVGDYQTIDWEKLAELRPDVMIIFMSGSRMPTGVEQRAGDLHIKLVNVKTERLDDIFPDPSRFSVICFMNRKRPQPCR